VARSWGDNENIERERSAVSQPDEPSRTVDGPYLVHDHSDIGVPSKNRAQRPGNIAGRERSSGHLVEQRLEEMVVGPVDEDHVDIAK
jgi:hypothetical protein